jgi:predicted nucleotidyltransferase
MADRMATFYDWMDLFHKRRKDMVSTKERLAATRRFGSAQNDNQTEESDCDVPIKNTTTRRPRGL